MMRNRLVRAAALTFLLLPAAVTAAENIVISGRITTLSGEPVSGAEVYLYSSANTRKPADFISPRSAPSGAYRMVVPKASYRAIARVKKGERYGPLMPGDRHSGEPVTVAAADEKELLLDFVVADMQEMAQRRDKELQELAEISGTISVGGRPLESGYAYARTGRLAATLPEYFSAWTAANGRYSLKLPPGHYFLGAAATFPPPEDSQSLLEVEVAAGNLAVAIDLQIPLK